VSVLFLLGGAAFGGWAGRIPTIKGALGLSDAQWGLVILASPVGSLLGLLLVTRLVPRLGSRALAIPGALLLLVMTPIAAASPSPWVLAPLLLVQGLAGGLLFSPMNALAVLVERRYRRSILSSFHAWFSVGQLGGGLVGAAAGALRVPPTVQFVATNLLLAALLALTARALPRDRPPPGAQRARPGAGAARTRFLPPQLLLLAVITLLTGINEGGALQWSAQYAVSLGATIAVGALTLSCFSLAVGVSRFLGDRVVERIGRVPFVRLSACVSALGMGIALLSGTVPLALVGFALLGLGSGCISPTVFALGGNQPGVPAGRGVAVISLGEWPAFLLGPPVIGGLAELVTLRGALGLLVVSAVGIGLLATRVKEHRLQEA
jgi:MFS family permease